jgi:hypothetical protein
VEGEVAEGEHGEPRKMLTLTGDERSGLGGGGGQGSGRGSRGRGWRP